MTRISKSICMLLSLLLLLAGCSGKEKMKTADDWLVEMRKVVHAEVSEPQRATAIIAELETLVTTLTQWQKSQVQFTAEFKALNANYDASRQEFQHLIEGNNSNRQQHEKRLWETRIRIRELSSEDEWQTISSLGRELTPTGMR